MTHLDDGADLRAVMERSMRDLEAPDRCGPAAMVTGRRLRTRRRVTVSLVGVAAVAAVAALTLPSLGGSGGASPQFAGDPTTAPTPSPKSREISGLPSQVPEGSGVPIQMLEGWWSAPGTRLAEQLEQVLPEGVTLESVDTTVEGLPAGSDAEMIGGLLGTLSASTGSGAFQIILYPPDLDQVPDPVTTTDAAGNEHTTATASSPALQNRIKCRGYMLRCDAIQDGAGEQVGRLTTSVESGTTYYEAMMLGPDGGALYFYVGDSTGEKPGYEAPTAEAPPLTLEQLRILAEDPVWTRYEP